MFWACGWHDYHHYYCFLLSFIIINIGMDRLIEHTVLFGKKVSWAIFFCFSKINSYVWSRCCCYGGGGSYLWVEIIIIIVGCVCLCGVFSVFSAHYNTNQSYDFLLLSRRRSLILVLVLLSYYVGYKCWCTKCKCVS